MAAGVDVVEIDWFGIRDNYSLAEPTPSDMANRVAVALLRRPKPSMLFVSCTQLPLIRSRRADRDGYIGREGCESR